MNNYKIVLTKSREVAETISKGFGKPDNWVSIGYGAVSEVLTPYIPSIYFNKDYYQATLITRCAEDENPSYELIFA